jgi:hypothetical protein
VLDNWKSDKYDWDKEIVLITGGAGGIGGHVVRLLAERGIKVVVLDVIPMSFETRMDSLSRILSLAYICSKKCLLLQMRHNFSYNDRISCSRGSQRCRRTHDSY